MKALFDDRIIEMDDFSLAAGDRGFGYGDGFFETMLAVNGHVSLLPYHWQRIRKALPVFGYRLPSWFSEQSLAQRIRDLILSNNGPEKARIKLSIWRKTGGRYVPEQDDVHVLIILEKLTEMPERIFRKVDLCRTIRNHPDPWSSWKTLSAMPYVLAGLEKKERGLDDLIILDHHDQLSEMLYSNLFWIRGDTFFTPSLETGCVAGVMRSFLLDRLSGKGISVKEVLADASVLREADHIFASNATGLIPVVGFQGRGYAPYPDLQGLLP